jgi:lipopolysaccharide transport system ATP-binding protein
MAILSCENLGKSFPMGKRQPTEVLRHELFGGGAHFREPFWALRHFDIEVAAGEAVGIVGQNGSGKSTLLQLIAGVYPPSEGRVHVAGKVAALLELGSGFDPDYTGRENVYMYGALLGLSREQINDRFDDIAAFADIGGFVDQEVRTYSSGMFVRLAFSVAIHVEASVLIVDEALAVGDARFAAKCMKRISRMREDGVTLFFVSHDVSAVRTLCDRAVWIHEGRIKALGAVPDVTARYTEHLFGDQESIGGAEEIVAPSIGTPMSYGEQRADASVAVNHWGSQRGSIMEGVLSGSSGLPGVYAFGEEMRLRINATMPQNIEPSAFSLAFSLKDLRGHDLHVCTTHDDNPGIFAGMEGCVEVTFQFPMRLTPGKYMLALAAEDRSSSATHYFEYIEGCIYLEVVSKTPRFGVFNLPVEIGVAKK